MASNKHPCPRQHSFKPMPHPRGIKGNTMPVAGRGFNQQYQMNPNYGFPNMPVSNEDMYYGGSYPYELHGDGQMMQSPNANQLQHPCKSTGNCPPLNVVVKVKQEGRVPQTKSSLTWSSSLPNGKTYTQKKVLDGWTGEQRICVGSNKDLQQGMYDANPVDEREIHEMANVSVGCQEKNAIDLAMQAQARPRFRAGGDDDDCGSNAPGNACQSNNNQSGCNGQGGGPCSSPKRSSQQRQSSPPRRASQQKQSKQNNKANGGCSNNVCQQRQTSQQYGQAGANSNMDQQMQSGCEMNGLESAKSKSKSETSARSKSVDSEAARNAPRFEFPTPDSLRLKLNEYIHNRPMQGKKLSGPLKPFRGNREDALSCKTCFSINDETTAPAACMPCGRLELTAEDFAQQELDAKKKLKAQNKRQAQEMAMAEVERFKNAMPKDFTPEEQIEYLKCLGASKKAICLFKELQQAETSCGPSTPDSKEKAPSCSKNESKNAQSQACSCCGDNMNGKKSSKAKPPSKPAQSCGKSDEDDIKELIRQCREELNETKQKHEESSCPSACPPLNPSADCYSQNTVDDDVKLYQMLAEKNAACQQNDEPSPCGEQPPACECPPCPPCDELPCCEPVNPCCVNDDESEEIDEVMAYDMLQEENRRFLEHPMFKPPEQKEALNITASMELYKIHLANLRKRYFGPVVKLIDDVENITPEIAAAMVYSEEIGYKMVDPPLKLYEYLYPESPSQPVISIADTVANMPEEFSEFADIVVPLVPPMFLTAAEFPGLEDPAMLDPPRIIQIGPSPKLAEEPAVTETKKASDVKELVQGMADQQMDEVFLDADEEEEEPEEQVNVFDIRLASSLPPHFCSMQMRGSQAPVWFPGYFFAYQSKPGVAVHGSHGKVLEQVWQDVQPDAIRPAGGALIIGE